MQDPLILLQYCKESKTHTHIVQECKTQNQRMAHISERKRESDKDRKKQEIKIKKSVSLGSLVLSTVD